MGLYIFKLPDLGEGTVESEVVEWYIKPGDAVAADQHIADVMTDKATVELSSPVAGTVLSLAGEAGDIVKVGSELIRFEVDGTGNVGADYETPEEEAVVAEEDEAVPADQPEVAAPAASGNYVFNLPDLGEGTVESEVVEWHVAVGDAVSKDQHIADVMTDKATVELSSPVDGVVQSLAGDAGSVVKVGSALITFAVEGQGNAPAAEQAKPTPESKPAAAQPATRAEVTEKPKAAAVEAPAVTASSGGKVLASPAVRRRALDANIDLADVAGSGPAGRVLHEDLDQFIAQGGKPAVASRYQKRSGATEIPVRGLRRMIAQKMQQSKRQIPHFTYVEEVDVTELEALRQHMNATRKPGQPKLSLLAYIMQALVKGLEEFPQFNATFDDENNIITRYEGVHLGIAAQTDDGLKVPVVKHAEAQDVWGLADEMKRVTDAAKNNTATKDILTGGSITITSLGPLGGLVHTPVINYPEVAIIGTNNMVERPVVRNGAIEIRKMMNLSSSFDHRVIDGYDAAQLIQRLKQLLEHPATLFV